MRFRNNKKDRVRFLGIGFLSLFFLVGCNGSSSNNNSKENIEEAPEEVACDVIIDESKFADEGQLKALMAQVVQYGDLRSTASEAHESAIDWIESEIGRIGGFEIRSDEFEIQRWQPTPADPSGLGRSLELAGKLEIEGQLIPVVGAVPYALGTGEQGSTGELIYLPRNQAITAAHAGKVILRDFPTAANDPASAPPFSHLMASASYMAPDMYARLPLLYERPFLGALQIHSDLIAAGKVGAGAVIFAFDVPREQVSGYFDPHLGIHFRLPAIFVGIDERAELMDAIAAGHDATVAVLAERDAAMTRNLIATLPGQSDERIVLFTNTDGNTWVQDNGIAAMLALADYFARQPAKCRPRTLEFAFNSAHLHDSQDGTIRYGRELNREFDEGSVAFTFAIEHLGTKEILAKPRANGKPGRELYFTGKAEPTVWFAPEDHPLMTDTAIGALLDREVAGMSILSGFGGPGNHTPMRCNFGGMGSITHAYLVPTMGLIAGPWSLWAPNYGADAVDFSLMRDLVLAIGDSVMTLNSHTSEEIAGPYKEWRDLREQGGRTCWQPDYKSEDAPL
ncbi:hypothetical protein [Marinobacter sediminicola]|uniref:hypothetical protein n=1 Tax=Marinobacter sediminicola TaxID=3072994 RepID=UPI0028120903|nr:hypothetical protein [Marinobacter sp. F26243]